MTTHLTPGATPGGVHGTVERVSARPNARWPYLVKRDDGTTRSYAPGELVRVEPKGMPLP